MGCEQHHCSSSECNWLPQLEQNLPVARALHDGHTSLT